MCSSMLSTEICCMIKIILCTLVSGLALLEWNFELILAFSGAFKLLACYLGPCILEYKSKRFMNEICSNNYDQDEENINDVATTSVTKQWIAHYLWLFVITAISLIAFLAVFVYTIEQYTYVTSVFYFILYSNVSFSSVFSYILLCSLNNIYSLLMNLVRLVSSPEFNLCGMDTFKEK